jgi:hypothetical protein
MKQLKVPWGNRAFLCKRVSAMYHSEVKPYIESIYELLHL